MSAHRPKTNRNEKAVGALYFVALCTIGGGVGFVLRRVFDFITSSYG